MEKQIAREHFTFPRLEKRFPREHFAFARQQKPFPREHFTFPRQQKRFPRCRSTQPPQAGGARSRKFSLYAAAGNSFHRSAITPGDSMQGWSHRPRRPSLFLLRELDWPAKAFSAIGITPSVVINQPDLELA